jgi:hypothetical protein
MTTRQEKIQTLTDNELTWFLDNGSELLTEVVKFFSEGGFNTYSDEAIDTLYNRLTA